MYTPRSSLYYSREENKIRFRVFDWKPNSAHFRPRITSKTQTNKNKMQSMIAQRASAFAHCKVITRQVRVLRVLSSLWCVTLLALLLVALCFSPRKKQWIFGGGLLVLFFSGVIDRVITVAFFPLSTLEEKASVVLSDAKRTRRRVVLRVVVFVRFELWFH